MPASSDAGGRLAGGTPGRRPVPLLSVLQSTIKPVPTARPSDDWLPLVADAVDDLTDERLRHILQRRLGLRGDATTLQEIADELSVSREWVRQLESKALQRINTAARRPATAALADAFDQLTALDDHALVRRLVETAGPQFTCPPGRLITALSRMAGHPRHRTDQLADLTEKYLTYRRQRIRAQLHERQRQLVIDQRIEKWVHDAAWPDSPDTRYAPATYRHRLPKTSNRVGHAGSFYSEKRSRTVYFESLLEESAFMTAEKSTLVTTYQEQPCAIRYSGIADDSGIYIPDLLITLVDGRAILIEVKPLWQMAVTDNRIKSAAAQQFAHDHGWGWLRVAEAGRTYQDLLRRPINPAAKQALTDTLATGSISWPRMQQLRQHAPIAALDVAAYAAQHNVGLSLTPYRLGP